MCFTSLESFHAASTEIYGSYPYTSIPRAAAAFATRIPIAPRPITPSFLPRSSVPANRFFSFSAIFSRSSFCLSDRTQYIPPTMSLAASSIPAITSSFTPFALAPGVLNTAIPCSEHFPRGMLLTPAPALPITQSLSENSISCITALLTRIASASSILSVCA